MGDERTYRFTYFSNGIMPVIFYDTAEQVSDSENPG